MRIYCGVDIDPGGVDDVVPGLIEPGVVDPGLVEPVEPIDPLVVEPARRDRLPVDELLPVPGDIEPIDPLLIDPSVAPGVMPGAVLPPPGVVLVIVPGVAPVPAAPPGLLPDICALAAVATRPAIITIIAFMSCSSTNDCVVDHCGVAGGGVAEFGASVPTRPSPVVPAVAAPIGGVTPVAG